MPNATVTKTKESLAPITDAVDAIKKLARKISTDRAEKSAQVMSLQRQGHSFAHQPGLAGDWRGPAPDDPDYVRQRDIASSLTGADCVVFTS